MKIKYVQRMLVIFFLLAIMVFIFGKSREKLVYRDSLDTVVGVVDKQELTLRDLAYYIAVEEQEVEEQARIYDYQDTNAYWNLHTNGDFIRHQALMTAIDAMVHDVIYAAHAKDGAISLDEQELKYIESRKNDFLMDLSEEQMEKLGVSEEEIEKSMLQMAYAEKYVQQYARDQKKNIAIYQVGGAGYEREKKEHKLLYKNGVIERIPMGNITLEH